MIKRKQKQGLSSQLEPKKEELLTTHINNNICDVGVLKLRLPVKNGMDSKTPGSHLSHSPGEETPAQVTAAGALHEGPAQRGSVVIKSLLHELPEKGFENLLPRRPVKLAPLELSKEVQASQQQKMKGIQMEATAAAQHLEAMGNKPSHGKVKVRLKNGLIKLPKKLSCDSFGGTTTTTMSLEMVLPGSDTQLPLFKGNNEASMKKEVPCRETPLPGKPLVPKSNSLKSKYHAQHLREESSEDPDLFQRSSRGHLPLRKGKARDEDQRKSKTSTAAGLSEDADGQPSHKDNAKVQRTQRALRQASQLLEKASRRNCRKPEDTGNEEGAGEAQRGCQEDGC
ncbi:uncharacterized protein LOC136759634 [Amia ocellicauda]|uniref:uncharacterized protein LOC136759634 n=1 Tax=Amia ocellicauda TaxID=2972642 RepID=UPI003464CE15